jgi:hypothetical protein
LILVDYSQISTAAFAAAAREASYDIQLEVELEQVRHMILNSIRLINSTYSHEYGEVVIAADMPNSWRKQIFPYYKANRKAEHDAQDVIDWPKLREVCKTVLSEMEQYLPYRVVRVENSEADDIIGVLARKASDEGELTLILSGDKDFVQLQADTIWIKQYCPRRSVFLGHQEPKRLLFEHVCKGDRGDGIPNILSPADSLVAKIRQKPVRQTKLDLWWEDPSEIKDLPRFRENIRLIDLKKTPKGLQEEITNKFDTFQVADRRDLLNYFVKFKLPKLAKQINDF